MFFLEIVTKINAPQQRRSSNNYLFGAYILVILEVVERVGEVERQSFDKKNKDSKQILI